MDLVIASHHHATTTTTANKDKIDADDVADFLHDRAQSSLNGLGDIASAIGSGAKAGYEALRDAFGGDLGVFVMFSGANQTFNSGW